MTRVVRARVVPAQAVRGAEPVALPGRASESVRRVPGDEVEARARAASIVRHAEDVAHALLERAHREATLEVEAAREAAHAEALGELVADLARARAAEERRAAASSDVVVALAVALAERLVGEELSIRPDRIEALATATLAQARGDGALRLTAHPADAAQLRASLADLGALRLSIEDDGALSRGSILLESDDGVLDARVGSQLGRLAAVVRAALEHD